MSGIKSQKRHQVVKIGVDQISDQPGIFCMSYGFDNTGLKKSIVQTGLINRPYIFRHGSEEVEIVTGFRRIQVLRELGIKEVDCLDLTDSGMSILEILRLAVHDNIFTRGFNLVEKSMILNRLNKIVKDDNLIKEFLLILSVNYKDYEFILNIEGLDNPIKDLISNGTLNIRILEPLLQLEESSILIIIYWINKLRLNYNYQVQFIDNIIDISRIYNISIAQVLNDESYITILNDAKKNVPQKTRELIDRFREKRNPDFFKYQELFDSRVKVLQLPANIKIKNPRYFESEGYRLEIDFKDGAELKRHLADLLDKDELINVRDPWLDE